MPPSSKEWDTTEQISERAIREQVAYDGGHIKEESARLHRRFQHVFFGPNSLRAERFLEDCLTMWAPNSDVLDVGCYTGGLEEILVPLEPRSIKGIDISVNAIEKARARWGRSAQYHVMDAMALNFPSHSFDLVVGRAILHHLDVDGALDEIHRVLRPGGHAIFVEPLRGNPLAALFRSMTPKARTTDESPLSAAQVRRGDSIFGKGEHCFVNLVSVPVGMVSSLVASHADNAAMRGADRVDCLLARTPLRFWMRMVVLGWKVR